MYFASCFAGMDASFWATLDCFFVMPSGREGLAPLFPGLWLPLGTTVCFSNSPIFPVAIISISDISARCSKDQFCRAASIRIAAAGSDRHHHMTAKGKARSPFDERASCHPLTQDVRQGSFRMSKQTWHSSREDVLPFHRLYSVGFFRPSFSSSPCRQISALPSATLSPPAESAR